MERCIIDPSVLLHPLMPEIFENLVEHEIPLISPRLTKLILEIEPKELLPPSSFGLKEIFSMWKLEKEPLRKYCIFFLREHQKMLYKSRDASDSILREMKHEYKKFHHKLFLLKEQFDYKIGAEVFADTVLLSLTSKSPILCTGTSLPVIVKELKKLKAKIIKVSKKRTQIKKDFLKQKGIRIVIAWAMGIYLVHILCGLRSALAALGCGALQVIVVDP